MRIWSVARYDLHLSESEFWQLTPRQLDALLIREKYKIEHDEFMLAQIAAVTINFAMGHPDKPVQPSALMPSKFSDKQSRSGKPRMTKKRRQNIADAFRAFGGMKVS